MPAADEALPPRGFRPATPADLDAVLALMQGFYAEDGYAFDGARARRNAEALLADASLGALWVAEVDGAVAGYLVCTLGFSFEFQGRDALIDELFLAPHARGQGLGREGMALAERWARAQGVRALHLEVEVHRDEARRFYERLGYVDHERRLMTRWLEGAPGGSVVHRRGGA